MEQRRLILIIALGFVLILLWQAWLADNQHSDQRDPAAEAVTAVDAQPSDRPAAGGPSSVSTSKADVPITASDDRDTGAASTDLIQIETDVLSLKIDPQGGVVREADLLEHPVSLDQPDEPIRLLQDISGFTYVAQSGLVGTKNAPAPDHHAHFQTD